MPDSVADVVASTFGIPASTVTDALAFQQSREWDSLNHISLMLSLEEAFDVTFDDDEIVEMTSVAAIRESLRRRGVLPSNG
jgi:citrate synthase